MTVKDGAEVAIFRRIFQADGGVAVMPAVLAEAAGRDNVKEMFHGVFGKEVTKHVIVPLNPGNDHWCGIVVHVEQQEFLYYDPMPQTTPPRRGRWP